MCLDTCFYKTEEMEQERMIEKEKFDATCVYMEVSEKNKEALRFLLDYQIELVLDDSFAMNSVDKGRGTRTCWKEMQELVTNIWTLLDTRRGTSFDMHFMSNGSLLGIRKREQIDDAFSKLHPSGSLNLMNDVLQNVLKKQRDLSYREGRLILVCTASNPESNTNRNEVSELKKILQSMGKNDYVTFISCTNNEKAVSFLSELGSESERVTVMKDFAREKGKCSDLTRGDYAAEALVRCLTSRKVSNFCVVMPTVQTKPEPKPQPPIYPNYGPYHYYPTYNTPQQIYYQPPLQQNQPTYYPPQYPQYTYGQCPFY